MEALGRHVIAEFYNCTPDKINNVSHVEKSMVKAAQLAGATIINVTFHHFSPFGISGVVVIEQSHLSIHTWPEYQFASIDLFTCGETINPWISFDHLKEEFGAEHVSSIELQRGQLHHLIEFPWMFLMLGIIQVRKANIQHTIEIYGLPNEMRTSHSHYAILEIFFFQRNLHINRLKSLIPVHMAKH